MRVISKSIDTLVLRESPWMVIVVSAAFLTVALLSIFRPNWSTEPVPLWMSLMFLLLSGFVIFNTKIMTLTFDKTSQTVRFKRRGLLHQEKLDIPMTEIEAVKIITRLRSNSGSSGYSYRVVLVQRNGQEIDINPGVTQLRYQNMSESPETRIGREIASFLNVPFSEQRPPNVTEVAQAIAAGVKASIEENRSTTNQPTR